MSKNALRIEAGVVDVVVLSHLPGGGGEEWRVLTLRRAAGVRCTGAWEMVHGSIEPEELPEAAAAREVTEETGLGVERLYSITVNPFYVPSRQTIQLATVFAAFVDRNAPVQLSNEHDAFEWRLPDDAEAEFAWPREGEAMRMALRMLAGGNGGVREDVLRVG